MSAAMLSPLTNGWVVIMLTTHFTWCMLTIMAANANNKSWDSRIFLIDIHIIHLENISVLMWCLVIV